MTQEQTLTNISVKMERFEVMQENNTKAITEMASSVNRLVDKLDKSDDVAKEALEKSKSAHHRIDETQTEIKEIKSHFTWLWKTVGGFLILGILGYFFFTKG